ncbi:hypothetical protein CV102_04895 [Natronococcus pandeyae]|uniref:Uncharacterized protein n=1 Tax=Natronococcus pandeyae TaxID=2055836 RepID=A0A8J8Q8A6_9EURY|nr:hypothetical protein CV102_04895 [Natronococcus pandeyae]
MAETATGDARVRDPTVDDARALTDPDEDYEWWADRDVDGVRRALAETEVVVGLSLLCRRGPVPYYETVGFELFDGEMEIPEGGTEGLVRMTYGRSEQA